MRASISDAAGRSRASRSAEGSVVEAGGAKAWGMGGQQQRVRSAMAVSRHSLSSSESVGGVAPLWAGAGPARGGWAVPAAALAMAHAAGVPKTNPQTASAQRPPVYRAADAASLASPGSERGGLNTKVSAKSGGRASGWNTVAEQQLRSSQYRTVAPRSVRRRQLSRSGARSSSRSSMGAPQKPDQAARARPGSQATENIVTPNRPADNAAMEREATRDTSLRMKSRVAEERRPGLAARDSISAGRDSILAEHLPSNTATVAQPFTDTPQCPLHSDCRLPPGHSGFCRLHGPRKEPQDTAVSAPIPPPRPVEEPAGEPVVEQAKERFEHQKAAWSEAQMEGMNKVIADSPAGLSERSARRITQSSPRGRKPGLTDGTLQASMDRWAVNQAETIDTTVSAKSGGASRGWPAVAAQRSKAADGVTSDMGKQRKLVRPASGRSWLAARRTAATNAGKAELGAKSPSSPAVRAASRRGPRAAVDLARATQSSLARTAESPMASGQPARPSSASLTSKKKSALRSAVMAASLGNASSLSLEEQLKKRITEKYRRDKPNIPMAVWLLTALQRTRVEACASNIIPARCLQDIPGVLHIPSGSMPKLVQKYGPDDEGGETNVGMVDYRKLVEALFPPLIGLHAPKEEPDDTVKTDGEEALAYLDYSAFRTRVRAEVGGNRSRLTDVFRIAMNAFGGRRLNVKVLQFAMLMLRVHITVGAIKHFFGAHISSGIVSGHGVAAEVMTTNKEKQVSEHKDEGVDEKKASNREARGAVSPAVSSPGVSAITSTVEATAAMQVAAIVAAAKEKSSKKSQLDQQKERARARAAEEGRSAANKAATDEVNSVLDKYLQLSNVRELPSTKLARKINASSSDKQLGTDPRPTTDHKLTTVTTANGSVDMLESSPHAQQHLERSHADSLSITTRMPAGTSNLEQGWAHQVSHRFGLAWSLKHRHSVVNPSMMEGVSDSSIQALWHHSSAAHESAFTEFTSHMLVRSDVAVRGGGVLQKLEEHATKPLNPSESFMDLDKIMALMSIASNRGRTWATKHAAPAGVTVPAGPPDPEVPDFLQNVERSFTRLELSRRPQVPAVPEQQIEGILQRAKCLHEAAANALVSGNEEIIRDNHSIDLPPTKTDDGDSRESSACSRSTLNSSPTTIDVDASPGLDQSDDLETNELETHEDDDMVKWEQQMMARRQSGDKVNMFGGYSSSDLSSEELDDEDLVPTNSGSDDTVPVSAGKDKVDQLIIRAQQSVEDLRQIENRADVQKWASSCTDAQAAAEMVPQVATGPDQVSDPTASIGEPPLANEGLSSPAVAQDEEELSETVQQTFSMVRLSQHPVVSSPNTFQLNGKIVKLPPSTVSDNTQLDSSDFPQKKRLARPASAPMRTRRWIKKDVTSHVDYLGNACNSGNDGGAADDPHKGPVAEDVLLGSLWLAQGADAENSTAANIEACVTRRHQQQPSAIAQAAAAALAEQQQLWKELRTKPTAEVEEEAERTDSTQKPTDREPSGTTKMSRRTVTPNWPKIKPGHKVQLLDLILFSSNIRAAILDALPWPTLRLCREICKRMALVCCEAVAQRPQIAVLGGNTGDSPTAKVTAFDLPTATWRQLPDMSSPRSNAAVCTTMDGRLLVAGGFDADGVHQSAEVFDPVSGRWTQLPPMSTARSGCRACPTLDSTNGAIVMGGYDSDLVTIASVECYDAHSNSWKAFPPLSSPRYDFSACVLPRTGYLASQRERIVVAGGTADTSAWLKTAEVFDGNSWSVLPSMSMQRDRCGACVLPSGAVAVLGGSITKGDSTAVNVHTLRTCETYDFVRAQWTDMPPMHAARCNFGAVAVPQLDGCVAVLGGEGGVDSRAGATAEVYHPRSNKWTVLTAMKEPRAGCGAAVLSVATWRSDIEQELSATSVIARIRARVSRPQQLTDSPVRFYKSEKEARAALYAMVSVETGSCLAQDMLIGKRYFTGQRSGDFGEGPVILVTATRIGGEIMFGDGSTGIIGS